MTRTRPTLPRPSWRLITLAPPNVAEQLSAIEDAFDLHVVDSSPDETRGMALFRSSPSAKEDATVRLYFTPACAPLHAYQWFRDRNPEPCPAPKWGEVIFVRGDKDAVVELES